MSALSAGEYTLRVVTHFTQGKREIKKPFVFHEGLFYLVFIMLHNKKHFRHFIC
jgi:hypothetical protein